jgi:uncharacterized protein (DUF3820 family)
MDCKHEKTIEKNLCDEATGEVKKIGIYCADCGKWIKWKRFVDNADFVMPFGKHKGKKLKHIFSMDLEYSKWAVKNIKGIGKRFQELFESELGE